MLFTDLKLIEPILRALKEEGYTIPTPIQTQAIPHLLENRDLLGCAQTGTGKTAAFAIPVLQNLKDKASLPGIKALILTPTRELAVQIADSFQAYGRYMKLKHTVVFGGVSQHQQTMALKKGVDILIATPGRLLDLMNQGFIKLNTIETLVLDEADRMLDMGFVSDIKKIIAKVPAKRQTIFFSATMPSEIQHLVTEILNNPIRIAVTPVSSAAETVRQAVYYVDKNNKKALLQHLIKEEEIQNVLVFTKTKHGADKVCLDLNRAGIFSEAIHGNKSQAARQRALTNFKKKTTKVLVATDIAARGIDIDDLTFVINYELPNCPETYIHRIGRTGRAGTKGVALSFCDVEETGFLRDINKLPNLTISVIKDHPYHSKLEVLPKKEQVNSSSSNRRNNTFRSAGNGANKSSVSQTSERQGGKRPRKTWQDSKMTY